MTIRGGTLWTTMIVRDANIATSLNTSIVIKLSLEVVVDTDTKLIIAIIIDFKFCLLTCCS